MRVQVVVVFTAIHPDLSATCIGGVDMKTLRVLLVVTLLSLAMVSISQPASAGATKEPTLKTSLRVKESPRSGTCTATVVVQWSNYQSTEAAFVGVWWDLGQVNSTPAATTASRGQLKESFTASYSTTPTGITGIGGLIYTTGIGSTTDETYDPSDTASRLPVNCATDWAVSS